jgi:Tfp pilus assembly protein PilW
MVTTRKDSGFTLIELVAGMAVAMIGFALLASVLITAQRQEKFTSNTARTVDEARLALTTIANQVRSARGMTQQGSDAAVWFDRDRDGLQDSGEVSVYGLRPDGATQKLIRQVDADQTILLRGISSGSFTVSIQRTGLQLDMSITLPESEAGRGGITLASKVVNRGNG